MLAVYPEAVITNVNDCCKIPSDDALIGFGFGKLALFPGQQKLMRFWDRVWYTNLHASSEHLKSMYHKLAKPSGRIEITFLQGLYNVFFCKIRIYVSIKNFDLISKVCQI